MERRGWMYDRFDNKKLSDQFYNGVECFINFATSNVRLMDGDNIKCPCQKCRNIRFHSPYEVREHLYSCGFLPNYFQWTSHGEATTAPVVSSSNRDQGSRGNIRESIDQLNPEQRMILDAAGPSFVPPTWFNVHNDFAVPNELETDFQEPDETEHLQPGEVNEDPNPPATDEENRSSKKFFDALRSAEEPLWSGCGNHTQLSFVARLMSLKADYNLSESCFNGFLQLIGEGLPSDHKLPSNYSRTKALVQGLGLPIKKIDICPEGCMLYWKVDAQEKSCRFCGHARYKGSGRNGKPIPHKVFRYLPLIPRLQRLYASELTAPHMTWHADHIMENGIMCHPSDGEAWKSLNSSYPEFASETRNVRLGLCTDGFAPFGQFGKNYSCWPIIVTPYNLPPDMCMKTEFMFLNSIVPGPKNPKKLIDICLQPLVDELMELWEFGVPTYDASRKEMFVMRAALIWTINDFPAYAMLSGWSTAGLLACPCCMENTKTFRLQHSRKACWFDCHRERLDIDHPYRRNRKDFYKGRQVLSPAPPMLTGEQIWERVRQFSTVIEEPRSEPPGYGKDHKWTKQSILWRLPYWKNLLLRHNLDVMHIEKNVFDNVFNTVMDDRQKTKDHLNARKDLKLYCHRPALQVDDNFVGVKPKAIYTLTKDERMKVFEWVKRLKFPDGYASNLSRCVHIDEGRLRGMKSHDCHVFMERLLPIALKEFLPSSIWGPLAELSMFFQSICSSKLVVEHMEKLEALAPLLLCKLERFFPPSFFDSMEHLLVHLPREAKIGGPPQYRWMYKVERFLLHLKQKIGNKAHVEASICEAYLQEEISNFVEHYFKPHVTSKKSKPSRNNDLSGVVSIENSIFNYPGKSSGMGKRRCLSDSAEKHAAHTYILVNCDEVRDYIEVFANELGGGVDDEKIDADFAKWFKAHVLNDKKLKEDKLLYSLAWGPKAEAVSWPEYFVNGYLFRTLERGENKPTMNSGICVKASGSGDDTPDFYGLLEEIIELEYIGGPFTQKVVLFKGRWFDPTSRGTKLVHQKYDYVEVNHKKLYQKYEPFILAQQAVQVYYADYPGAKRDRVDWWAVCKTKPRSTIEELWSYKEPAYQSDETLFPEQVIQSVVEDIPEHLSDPTAVADYIEEEDDMIVTDDMSNEDEELWNTYDSTSEEESEFEDNHESEASE